jgi:hypothetical protein
VVLRSDQQLSPGQIQKCELDQGMASLWNELLPRLRQLSDADIKGDISIRNTDSRLGQGERPAWHFIGIQIDAILLGFI